MSIDVAAAREQTTGTARVAHLNNAGASLPTTRTTDAVIAHLKLEAAIGGYEAAAASSGRIQRCYSAVAELLSCAAHEVAIVENATRAWDMAFYGLRFATGDRILTGRAEYASNAIAMLQVSARTGARVEVIDDDQHGQIDLAALEAALDTDVKLVALTPRTDSVGSGQSGRRGRPADPDGRRAVPAGRLPVGQPTAPGRRGARLRSAVGHRPEVRLLSALPLPS